MYVRVVRRQNVTLQLLSLHTSGVGGTQESHYPNDFALDIKPLPGQLAATRLCHYIIYIICIISILEIYHIISDHIISDLDLDLSVCLSVYLSIYLSTYIRTYVRTYVRT